MLEEEVEQLTRLWGLKEFVVLLARLEEVYKLELGEYLELGQVAL